MKAITLRHPWPFAVCYWGKRIENRVWQPRTELKPGDRFAIHGGRPPTTAGNRQYLDATVNALLQQFGIPRGFERFNAVAFLKASVKPGIVATAVLDRVVTKSDDPWFCGPFGWVMRDVIVLDAPITISGAQGLWTVPPSVVAELQQLGAV